MTFSVACLYLTFIVWLPLSARFAQSPLPLFSICLGRLVQHIFLFSLLFSFSGGSAGSADLLHAALASGLAPRFQPLVPHWGQLSLL